jgi:putative intracellular protease/amidase
VVFATERGGAPPEPDPRTREGALFGWFAAGDDARAADRDLSRAPAFVSPRAWGTLAAADFDALYLPGGHARGMRQYLEATPVQSIAVELLAAGRPVAAICHGVLVLARARDPRTGKSPLAQRRTTCLPKYMERAAWLATAWRLGRYYRTYEAYVEDEVRAAAREFVRGPRVIDPRRVVRASDGAFVVEDDHYLSARWPGDAALLARKLLAKVA